MLSDELARVLEPLGGYLRCEVCGFTQSLGDVGVNLTSGWPSHHGLTMRWWTGRQVAAGVPPLVEDR